MAIPLKSKTKNYDNTLTGKLIRFVENPDSVGFINGLWYSPKFDSRYNPKAGNYDIFNFGMGVDRNTNEYVQSGELTFHKDKQGREYLTPEEERNVRNHAIANAEASYNDRLKYAQKVTGSNVTPSEMKKALTISAIYNLGSKRVADNLFEDKSLMDSLLNGSDIGYSNEINRYYDKYNKANRGDKTNEFIAKNIVSSKNNTRNPLDVKIISKSTDGNNLVPQNPRTSFFTRVKRALEAAKNSAPSGYGRWEDGGQLSRPKLWDDLSMTERAEMIKAAINNGIYNLDDIRSQYNEFAKGGNLFDGLSESSNQMRRPVTRSWGSVLLIIF